MNMETLLDRLEIVMRKNTRAWTQEEDDYLRDNLGFLPEEEIAEKLGRTRMAVHLRWKRDLRLPAPSKDPRYLTGLQIANLLGVDGHISIWWIDNEMMPGERLPGERVIRRVLKTVFVAWVLDPENWVYFNIERVSDPNLRRLIEAKKAEWGDEWWNTRKVAEYLGITVCDVKRYIQLGRIRARRVPGRGGRHPNPYWANWFILRSEATRPDIIIYRKKHG